MAGGGPGGPHAMVPPLSARLAGHWPAGLRVGAAGWAGQCPGYNGHSGHLQQGPPGSGRPGSDLLLSAWTPSPPHPRICLSPCHLVREAEAPVLAWSSAGLEAEWAMAVGSGRPWAAGPESAPLSLGLGLRLVSSPGLSPSPAQAWLRAVGAGGRRPRAGPLWFWVGAGALSLNCAGFWGLDWRRFPLPGRASAAWAPRPGDPGAGCWLAWL